ncbi:MAG: hypothetical protein LW860_18530, partial [Xanthomonadaceae bacterium]|nr:hypothetical protein [Xanthomonadaceae bacterium]
RREATIDGIGPPETWNRGRFGSMLGLESRFVRGAMSRGRGYSQQAARIQLGGCIQGRRIVSSILYLDIALGFGAAVVAVWVARIRSNGERVRLVGDARWPMTSVALLAGLAGLATEGAIMALRLMLLVTVVPMLLVLFAKRPRLRRR